MAFWHQGGAAWNNALLLTKAGNVNFWADIADDFTQTRLAWVMMCYGQGSLFPTARRPGAIKLPIEQVDLDRFFFFISYKQIEEFQNSWSRASDDFEKRRALVMVQQYSRKICTWGLIEKRLGALKFKSP